MRVQQADKWQDELVQAAHAELNLRGVEYAKSPKSLLPVQTASPGSVLLLIVLYFLNVFVFLQTLLWSKIFALAVLLAISLYTLQRRDNDATNKRFHYNEKFRAHVKYLMWAGIALFILGILLLPVYFFF
jgi:hypothetical protein